MTRSHSKSFSALMSHYDSLPKTLANQLSISSLNVLADDYVDEPKQDHLSWMHRRKLLHEHFTRVNSDIVCLQEVQLRHFQTDFLAHFRTLGYEGVMQDTNHIVGVATFFKTSKFRLAWTESRSRAMMVGLHMKINEAEHNGNNNEEDEEELVLEVPVMVANVHLEGVGAAKRFSQMKSLLKRCELRLAGATPEESLVFICGDFNTGVQGGAAMILETGELGPEFVEEDEQTTPTHFRHPFKFATAYSAPVVCHPTFYGRARGLTIDHIYFPRDLADTLGVLCIRHKELEEIKDLTLPTATHPSDHLPVGAVFQLKAKTLEHLRRKFAKT